ncbi:MAG: FixH family protein [Ignavibacteria bacterium]|nr:FixH family protein [Ignavibacteria bacterium]
MSWGIKIILVFIIFAGGLTALVIISMSKNVDLVHEQYYEEEINYQKHIDILEQSKILNEDINVTVDENNIKLKLNKSEKYNNLSGKINFYRSSDASKDFIYDLKIDESGEQMFPVNEMISGSWKLKFELNRDGKNYFVEKNIFIN